MTVSQAASSPATPSTKPAQAETADRTGDERENRFGVLIAIVVIGVLVLSTSILYLWLVNRPELRNVQDIFHLLDSLAVIFFMPVMLCIVATFPAMMIAHYRSYGFVRVQKRLQDTLSRIHGLTPRDERGQNETQPRFWFPTLLNIALLIFLFGMVFLPEAGQGLDQQLFYTSTVERGNAAIVDIGAYVDYIVEHASMITWCFLGAYFYILTVLVRRWMRSDLSPGLIWKLNVRLMIAVILGFVMELLWGQGEVDAADPLLVTTSQTALAAVAFFVGIVPGDLFRWLQVKLGALLGKLTNVADSDALEKQIDGINFWQMDRLNEEGIESVEDLAMVDIPRLLSGTRFDAPHVMYWIDQALLVHSVGDDIDKFKTAYVRTATDFLDCYTPTEGAALPVDGLPAGHLNNLRTALENSPNIIYVRNYWDSFKQERVSPPEPDPSPSI